MGDWVWANLARGTARKWAAGAILGGVGLCLVAWGYSSSGGLFPVASATAQETASQTETTPKPTWAASATGRIEPKDGEVRIGTQVAGQVDAVFVKMNNRVVAGDLLVRIDDTEARTKRAAADVEVLVRKRERDDDTEPVPPLAEERRKAEDALSDAERSLHQARMGFDAAVEQMSKGQGTPEAVTEARARMTATEAEVATQRAALAELFAKPDMPLPTRLEASLSQSRADLALAETAVERSRVHAPFDGTVLSLQVKTGELVAPSPELVLLSMGDLTSLRVRAEVEERDIIKVRVGQKIVVRADAFPDRDFSGQVTEVAQALAPPRLTARGPRRPNDVEVLEVVAILDGMPPLLTGMRVDVFFVGDAVVSESAVDRPSVPAN